jgi:type IV pilus assembly protein PilB
MIGASLKDRLQQILIDGNLITQEQLDRAMEIQKSNGGQLRQVLIDEGYITQQQLMVSLSEHLGIPPIDISKLKISEEVASLISKQVCRSCLVVPISKMGNTLTVAMADPLNVFTLDDLRLMTGMEIQPVISNPEDVEEKLSELFSSTKGLGDILQAKAEVQADAEIVEEKSEDEIDIDELIEQTGDTSIIQIVNVILVQAVQEAASDIHIEPFEKEISLRYRIDGVLYERTPPPKHMNSAIVSRIKIMSNLDIAERRLPQDGRFRIRLAGKEIDFRVSILPTAFGEKVVMRILDKTSLDLRLESLGFSGEALDRFRNAINAPYGMILVTGPTGSGKTTTLYASLLEISRPEVNIITVEDPIEYQLKGINQVQVNQEIGLTFAAGLRSMLRQDPDIVMVGEIRDLETADIAVKAALTGHLVLSTLHTNDASGAIARLNDMGIVPFLISSSLILVQAQRLVRRICPNCKEEVTHDRRTLERAQLFVGPDGNVPTLYKGAGCVKCNGSGYSGRQSVLEVLHVTENVRVHIIKESSATLIKEEAMRSRMKTLRMDALDKALAGTTTLEEVLRVTAADNPDVINEIRSKAIKGVR